MHGCVFFPGGSVGLQELVRGSWLDVAAPWGAGERGQVVKGLYGLPGWFQYQAKHSSRGVRHYQRANKPESWERTGRLWGVVGEWPVREEVVEVGAASFWRFRRSLRSWLVAGARREGDWRRAAYLRGLLRDPDRQRSAVRAVGEFCPESVARQLLRSAGVELELSVDPETGEILR